MKKFTLLLSLIITTSCLFACSINNGIPTQESTKPTPTAMPSQDIPAVEPSPTFSSAEEAYYHKYVELAETYGTHTLYELCNAKRSNEHTYLNGVCIVNLMDYNGDGIQDLFVVYSNGQFDRVHSNLSRLEIYDFPTKNSYEIEVWTYKDKVLSQLLHEPYVSSYAAEYFSQYFITIYENSAGLPIIQLCDVTTDNREYTNIYYSGGKTIRDILTYSKNGFHLNGREITESAWNEAFSGYNKILLCSLLADSTHSTVSLAEVFGIDYDNTLLQTEAVLRHLSGSTITPKMTSFNIAEGKYISLYLQELNRSNPLYSEFEFAENHNYNLYDMDQNGVPELILYEGHSGAGMHYHFYTIIDDAVVDCGFYGRTNLQANGEGGLIAYFGRMSGYSVNKITLRGSTIEIQDIAGGMITAEESYPELESFGYENYTSLHFCTPAIPFAMYAYN